MKFAFLCAATGAALFSSASARADSLGAAYSSDFAFTVFTTPLGLKQLGGLVIDPNNPNVLLIGGNAASGSGEIYSVPLTRDSATQRITGLGAATFYAFAPDIDGGLIIAPDDDLLFTEYPDNQVGELEPGSTTPDKTAASALTPVSQGSNGGMTFIPAGMPGAGSVVFTSYSHAYVCAATATPDGSGTYNIGSCTNLVQSSGPLEGIAYVPGGSGGFSVPTVLISTYNQSTGASLQAYQLDSNGLPILSTATTFFQGSLNEGVTMDPVTGNILATSYSHGAGAIYEIYSTAHPTPEPGTAVLAALGVAIALLHRRRAAQYWS